MLSLDEAIAHEREVAKKNREICRLKTRENAPSIFKCAEEHEQIAEWLEELKDYRDKNKMVVRIDCINSEEFNDLAVKLAKEQYNKAIDDVLNTIDKYCGSQRYLVSENIRSEIEQLKESGAE